MTTSWGAAGLAFSKLQVLFAELGLEEKKGSKENTGKLLWSGLCRNLPARPPLGRADSWESWPEHGVVAAQATIVSCKQALVGQRGRDPSCMCLYNRIGASKFTSSTPISCTAAR